CGDGCGVCPCPTPCTCPTCTCPNCSYCSAPQAFQPAEYVVEMKLLKAGADGDDEVQMCPRVTVLENQTASVEMLGVESSQEQCCHRIQATVMKSVKGVVLNLHVEDSCARAEGEFGGRAHTETTAIRCPVALDTTNKLELVQGVDGAYRSWVEVRVTEVNGKATPTKAAACTCPKVKAAVAEEEDQDDQGLSGAIDVIQGFFEMGADAAAGMAQSCGCCDDKPSVCTPPVNFDGDPLTYVPCTRCSAVEAAKQPTAHVSIDFSHDRKCVEVNNGDKHFKATADHIVMQDDCIRLEGDVRAESCDDSGHTTHITTDHLTVNSKDGAMKIDGATEIHLGD
ncbi:MAG TPA: LPS export ABC transporter periplasmic protein LptC, partial [Gemmataceae bacterium]|nr:LPS export ABC transporter periplasmic protein LptC [Gemmataceae bacterium]